MIVAVLVVTTVTSLAASTRHDELDEVEERLDAEREPVLDLPADGAR